MRRKAIRPGPPDHGRSQVFVDALGEDANRPQEARSVRPRDAASRGQRFLRRLALRVRANREDAARKAWRLLGIPTAKNSCEVEGPRLSYRDAPDDLGFDFDDDLDRAFPETGREGVHQGSRPHSSSNRAPLRTQRPPLSIAEREPARA